jgi:hypothetical protein
MRYIFALLILKQHFGRVLHAFCIGFFFGSHDFVDLGWRQPWLVNELM